MYDGHMDTGTEPCSCGATDHTENEHDALAMEDDAADDYFAAARED